MIGHIARTAVVLVGLSFLGCRSDVFRFQIVFPETPALKEGSPVRYLGLEVGKVERIVLTPSANGGPPEISVVVALKEKTIPIRQDDKFSVGTQGLLGEGFVNIQPGPPNSPPIPAGSSVRGETPTLPLKTLSSYQFALEIGAKLDSLPAEKREQLRQTFIQIIDAALEEQRHRPTQRRESARPKK